jgi:hypothetical protein
MNNEITKEFQEIGKILFRFEESMRKEPKEKHPTILIMACNDIEQIIINHIDRRTVQCEACDKLYFKEKP